MQPGTVLVHQTRDGRVQTMHSGHAVLVGKDGEVEQAWGDPAFPTYWRSAPKPLQAIPFAAAMDDLGLDERTLALACASHSGEPEHVAWVQAMLNAGGLDAADLQCGTHPPMTRHSIRPPGGQEPIHNNCSGKHAAMLLACVANDWPTDTYAQPDHPLQVAIEGLVREATGRADVPWGTDGCGLPTYWLPIVDLARSYQWVARHAVGRRCIDAMAAHPWFVAGSDRFCTFLGSATKGRCVGKIGAAGVYVLLHRPSGGVVAVKITDGDARAAESVAVAVADAQGWLEDREGLRQMLPRPVVSNDGRWLGAYEVRL